MRYKRRYVLVKIIGITSAEEASKAVYSTMNRLYPLLGIKSNFRVLNELAVKLDGEIMTVVSVSNKYINDAIFILSLMRRFYNANLITVITSGSLRRIKSEEKKYGSDVA